MISRELLVRAGEGWFERMTLTTALAPAKDILLIGPWKGKSGGWGQNLRQHRRPGSPQGLSLENRIHHKAGKALESGSPVFKSQVSHFLGV